MATTYTLTAPELAKLQDFYDTLHRSPAFKQIVRFLQQADIEYGATGENGLNGLGGHVVSAAGVVTADATDLAVTSQYPYFI